MPRLASAEGLYFNPGVHVFSIMLSFASCVLFMMVVFNNAPLDHVKSTLESRAEQRFWLLVVNETSDTIVFEKRSNSIQLHDNTAENYTESLEIRENTNENNLTEVEVQTEGHGSMEKRGGSGIHAYGFGIWGWCEWSEARWTENAKCTKKPFWTLPKCVEDNWDNVEQLLKYLPFAITNVLSIISFFIAPVPFLVFAYFILLCWCIKFDGPYPPWPVPPRRRWSKKVKNRRTVIAWKLRDWRTNLIIFAIMFALILPTIVVVIVGKMGVKSEMGVGGGLKATTGNGSDFMVGAWLMFLAAQGLTMTRWGLIRDRETEKDGSEK